VNSISTANSLYMRKEFEASLIAYQRAYVALTAIGSPPKSLVTHCERRIQELKARNPLGAPTIVAAPPAHTVPDVVIGNVSRAELPSISIVIPHYESLEFLREALRSIDGQSQNNVEVIVIDDASPVARAKLESALRELALRHPVRLICSPINRGPSYCRNLGIEAARGRIVCFLDADDFLDESSLQSRWELLNGHASESAAFTSMQYVNGTGASLDQVILRHQEVVSYRDFSSNKFPCSTVAVKRKYLEADRFDERLTSGEDYEFFSRLAQRGVIYRECKGVIHYRQHPSSLTHKDLLGDVRARMAVSEIVFKRTLRWASKGRGQDLPTSIRETEVVLRTFPVACVLALRGELDRAIALAAEIDFDYVAGTKVGALAGSIRFFLARELIVPQAEVPNLLAAMESRRLADLLAKVVRLRHLRFAVHLLRALLVGNALKQAEAHLHANLPLRLETSTYSACSDIKPDFDYVVLHQATERVDHQALQVISTHLRANQHLEGLLLYKTVDVQNEPCIMLDSIGPGIPDSREMEKLGVQLFPGVVLDRESFLIIRNLAAGMADFGDEASAYVALLKLLFRLRIKLVGGLPGACLRVLADSGDAQ
jgi:glycosyltransferase involved in cell wall biosynthesis